MYEARANYFEACEGGAFFIPPPLSYAMIHFGVLANNSHNSWPGHKYFYPLYLNQAVYVSNKPL